MSFEVELSAEELRNLLQPSIAAQPASVPASSPAFVRSLRLRAAVGASAAIGVAVFAGLVAYKSARTQPAVPLIATAPASSPEAPLTHAMPAPEQPPVRFANPFDRTEVFEFPPGTSRAEARARVAELLRKRAEERGYARR